MKNAAVLLLLAAGVYADQSFTIDVPQRNKKYVITTRARGIALDVGTRWVYQPSVIRDNGTYYMLFVTCQNPSNCQVTNQGLYLATSTDGVSFGNTTLLLGNPPGVCDFVAARGIKVNGTWQVYAQGSETCVEGQNNNAIYVARGTSLTALQWQADPNRPGKALRVIHIKPRPNQSCAEEYPDGNDNCYGEGIGEDHQWFNVDYWLYRGANWAPILGSYNDWNLPSLGGAGIAAVGYNGYTDMSWWYSDPNQPYSASTGVVYPDVMLGGTEGVATYGNPALKVQESCTPGNSQWRPLNSGTVFVDPYPYDGPTLTPRTMPGATVGPLFVGTGTGHFETVNASGQSVVDGSAFRPRFGRNPYGFVDAVPGSNPRTWTTFVYYTATQINRNASDSCGGYTNWPYASQKLGVSEVTITEQPR